MFPFAIAVLGLAGTATAALVPADSTFGPDSVTQDTDTGLEWLDLTLSTGVSHDQMAIELAPGGAYEGWRYATDAEVDDLFNVSAGITATPGTQAHGDQVAALLALIGTTSTVGNPGDAFYRRGSDGFLDIVFGLGHQIAGLGVDLDASLQVTYSWDNVLHGSGVDDVAFSGIGHWLVRDMAAGPTLDVVGSCPGNVTISATGLTPGGRAVLLGATSTGSEVLPDNPFCAGTTGLGPFKVLAKLTADAGGELSFVSPPLSAQHCGRFLQLVDAGSCDLTNVAQVP